MFFDRGNHYEFLSLGQELAAPGDLQHPQTFPFNFKNVEKQYESYNGINVKLRYFVRVTVSRRMADVIREKDIWVYSYRIRILQVKIPSEGCDCWEDIFLAGAAEDQAYGVVDHTA
jgi:hypothetical protein